MKMIITGKNVFIDGIHSYNDPEHTIESIHSIKYVDDVKLAKIPKVSYNADTYGMYGVSKYLPMMNLAGNLQQFGGSACINKHYTGVSGTYSLIRMSGLKINIVTETTQAGCTHVEESLKNEKLAHVVNMSGGLAEHKSEIDDLLREYNKAREAIDLDQIFTIVLCYHSLPKLDNYLRSIPNLFKCTASSVRYIYDEYPMYQNHVKINDHYYHGLTDHIHDNIHKELQNIFISASPILDHEVKKHIPYFSIDLNLPRPKCTIIDVTDDTRSHTSSSKYKIAKLVCADERLCLVHTWAVTSQFTIAKRILEIDPTKRCWIFNANKGDSEYKLNRIEELTELGVHINHITEINNFHYTDKDVILVNDAAANAVDFNFCVDTEYFDFTQYSQSVKTNEGMKQAVGRVRHGLKEVVICTSSKLLPINTLKFNDELVTLLQDPKFRKALDLVEEVSKSGNDKKLINYLKSICSYVVFNGLLEKLIKYSADLGIQIEVSNDWKITRLNASDKISNDNLDKLIDSIRTGNLEEYIKTLHIFSSMNIVRYEDRIKEYEELLTESDTNESGIDFTKTKITKSNETIFKFNKRGLKKLYMSKLYANLKSIKTDLIKSRNGYLYTSQELSNVINSNLDKLPKITSSVDELKSLLKEYFPSRVTLVRHSIGSKLAEPSLKSDKSIA
jgi:hypothetical protein